METNGINEKMHLTDEIEDLRHKLASARLNNSVLSQDIRRIDDLGEKHKKTMREKKEKWSAHMHPVFKSLIAFAVGTAAGLIYFAIIG